MTAMLRESRTAGLLGPVALSGALLLLVLSPLMRGGNRFPALIPLEIIGLLVLVALWTNAARQEEPLLQVLTRKPLLALLVMSPLLLALVQLTPLPDALWARLPGHSGYVETLKLIGAPQAASHPLSISPDATLASLLAGLPVAAAFMVAYLASLAQLRPIMWCVAAMAFAQVLFGLMQMSGGMHSPLFFGMMSYGNPIGSFANRNHYANYIAMALVGFIWLAYETMREGKQAPAARRSQGAFTSRHVTALWITGGLIMVLGLLMTRSRGAAVFGLPMAVAALGVVSLRIQGWSRGLRFAVPVTVVLLVAAGALIGFEAVTSRISANQLASSGSFRGLLARTSFDAAMAFWPWGSGWGTYDLAYPRFQPAPVAGYANHAHQDYVEMLLEGGIFFIAIAAAFTWLAARRALLLIKMALRDRKLNREAMASAICGLGLAGFLLHSLVEFNMRIPANAILATLLAGVYLRPLPSRRKVSSDHDRFAQSHPAGY
jgi:hypothetical protein